jgi:hypothetical protein
MSISKKTYDEAKTKGDQKSIIKASVGYQKYLTLRAVRWSFTIYMDNYFELIQSVRNDLKAFERGDISRKQDRVITLNVFNTITSSRSFLENMKKVLKAEDLKDENFKLIEQHKTNNFFRAFRNYLMHNGVNITNKKLTFTNETDLIEKKIAVKTTPILNYLEVRIEEQKKKNNKTGFDVEALIYLKSKSPELDLLNELILQRKLMTEMYSDFLKNFITKNSAELNKLKADLDAYHILPPNHLGDIILKIPFRHLSILLKSSKL